MVSLGTVDFRRKVAFKPFGENHPPTAQKTSGMTDEIVKPKPDAELVLKVAVALSKAFILLEPYLVAKYNVEAQERFKETFNKAMEALWKGTDQGDLAEKERYETLAKVVLHAMGYEVEISNELVKALLV
jgi:hypothetical protein